MKTIQLDEKFSTPIWQPSEKNQLCIEYHTLEILKLDHIECISDHTLHDWSTNVTYKGQRQP